jgi:hypothetical protein
MAGLVPAIHVLLFLNLGKDVDARDELGHDKYAETAIID